LTCKGRAKAAAKLEPMGVNMMSIARDADSKTQTVKITRGDGGPLALELLPPTVPGCTAELRTLEPGERYELDVTVKLPLANDRLNTQLTLKTGVADAPDEFLQVNASVEPRLRADPPRFMLQREIAEDLEVKSRLIWSGKDPGKVTLVTCSDPVLKVSTSEQDGMTVVVLNVPKGYQPANNAPPAVTVETDDLQVARLPIPIVSMARPIAQPTGAPLKPPPGGAPATPTLKPAGVQPVVRAPIDPPTRPQAAPTPPAPPPPASQPVK
jgi:hypothetical protein